jgi:hypothetical protein
MRFLKFLVTLSALAFLLPAEASAQKQNVNYDEAAVAPYELPDPLVFANGKKVRKNQWPERRREILDMFQHEMYGVLPPKGDGIFLETIEEGPTLYGQGIRRQVRMWFRPDKTGPKVDWLIVTPNNVEGPVPVVLLYNYTGNHAVLGDPEILVPDSWFAGLFGEQDNKASVADRGKYNRDGEKSVYPIGTLAARGYATVTACYNEVSPDPNMRQEKDGVKMQDTFAYTGIFDLWGPRDPAKDDNTTSLMAWAWVLMRAMDMIESDPTLDQSRVILTGYSRLAKAALVAGAFDDRFPVVVPVQTGGGGVPLAKRNFGESVATEVVSFRHWFCRAYDKYADNTDALPFDQHMLLACVAPRALLVEGFNQPWFDTKGEYLAVKAASPVWKFLGKKGMPNVEWPSDYDTSAIGRHLGYVRRAGDHGITPIDWEWMLDFAEGVWRKGK